MNNLNFSLARARRAAWVVAAAALLLVPTAARAESWSGIEPLKSRRSDVEKALGKPVEDKPGQQGTLQFKVKGGTVTVVFVTARFAATHKLAPELEGTVLQIRLQHENAPDTAETLRLVNNGEFERDARGDVTVYRNQRDGVAYTFIQGRLRTTYYTASSDQLKRSQKG